MAKPRRSKAAQDDFQATFRPLFEYLSSRLFYLASGLLGLLLLFGLLLWVSHRREAAEEAAWASLRELARQKSCSPEERARVAGSSAYPYFLFARADYLFQQAQSDIAPPGEKRSPEKQVELLAQARQELTEMLARFPKHSLALYARESLALVLEELGENHLAIEELSRALAGYPGSFLGPKLQYEMARNYWLLGEHDQARQTLEKALAYPGSPGALWLENAQYLAKRLSEEARGAKPPEAPPAPPQEPPPARAPPEPPSKP